jgi:crossover junction endodeoxyribonuclease RuvC
MRIIGFDPGIDRLGWAVVEADSPRNIKCLSYGLISTDRKTSSADRLYEIFNDVTHLLERFSPDFVIAEELYFAKNVTTGMVVSEVRGVLKVCTMAKAKPFLEIHPMTVKKKLTGYGNAKKNQVRFVVSKIFGFEEPPKPDDVADAIAIAYLGILEQVYKI